MEELYEEDEIDEALEEEYLSPYQQSERRSRQRNRGEIEEGKDEDRKEAAGEAMESVQEEEVWQVDMELASPAEVESSDDGGDNEVLNIRKSYLRSFPLIGLCWKLTEPL